MLALERPRSLVEAAAAPDARGAVDDWVRSQHVNLRRAVRALQPFTEATFGSGPAAPSPAQLEAVNALVAHLARRLGQVDTQLARAAERTAATDEDTRLARFQQLKGRGQRALQAVEKIWEFYFELFGQRLSPYADQLLAADRVATDCYQAVYLHLGRARSIPSPRPLSYIDTGFSPATFRRGVRMSAIGRNRNPFPLVVFPRSRLVSPWTLGAVPHEVGHNLQSDLGLWLTLRDVLRGELESSGFHPLVVKTFTRWHKEMFADLIGVLLIGPAFVHSLMDVVGAARTKVVTFQPGGAHPTPYLRVPLNLLLLRRIGFEAEAARIDAAWQRLYPRALRARLPEPIAGSFEAAADTAVSVICFRRYAELGGQSLVQTVAFSRRDQALVEEGAARLARNRNTGILPSRFLIAAARTAFDRRLAPPDAIARNFYQALVRR